MDANQTFMALSIQAQIAAVQARIAGMEAENAYRAFCGNSPAYCQDAFELEVASLNYLGQSARNLAG